MKKQKHKSKEELIHDAKIQMEVIRKRNKAKDELYPFLLKSSKNIEDAQVFCQSLGMAITQGFNIKKKEYKVKDLDLISKLDPKNSNYEVFKEAITMFENENLLDAVEVIDGMANAIGSFVREETTTRSLDSLKATFL